MSLRLRPGVYASYEVGDLAASDSASALVGIAAVAAKGKAALVTGLSQAVGEYGECSLTKLIRCAMLNGAARVYAVPVENNDYGAAFDAMLSYGGIACFACDGSDGDAFDDIKASLDAAGEAGRFAITVLECAGEGTEAAINAARGFNAENVMLLGNTGDFDGALSAAAAGLIAGRRDPALPLNGEALKGVSKLCFGYTDAETELLIESGVTPLETLCGEVCIIRGVSTRTVTGGVKDASYRDINTAMVINRVLPTVKSALRRSFAGAKFTAHTKAAIRSLVAVELEKLRKQEIITAYGGIRAEASESDPSVCIVSFDFSAARGLHIIELTAHVDM